MALPSLREILYPGATSVISRFSHDPHFPHTRLPSSVRYTAVDSHFAHSAVGSVESGSGSGGITPVAVPPLIVVAGSNVVPQLPHTWLKQQFGVQL